MGLQEDERGRGERLTAAWGEIDRTLIAISNAIDNQNFGIARDLTEHLRHRLSPTPYDSPLLKTPDPRAGDM